MEIDPTEPGTSRASQVEGLEGFRSASEELKRSDRRARLEQLEMWMKDALGGIICISRLLPLAICCWEEIDGICKNGTHNCGHQILSFLEKMPSYVQKILDLGSSEEVGHEHFKVLWHLFMCGSCCIRAIEMSNVNIPAKDSENLILISTILDLAHMVFLSPRWLQFAGKEGWVEVVNTYNASTKNTVHRVVAAGVNAAMIDKMSVALTCKKLSVTGLAIAKGDTVQYSVLKTVWTSLCHILNAVHESHRRWLAGEINLAHILWEMVQQFHTKLSLGHKHNDVNLIKVSCFWLGLISKLMPGYNTSGGPCWTFMARTCAHMQHFLSPLESQKEGPVMEMLRERVADPFGTVLSNILEGMTKKEQQVALGQLHEKFEGSDFVDGRALTVLQLAWKSADMSVNLMSQMLSSMAWMIRTLTHDFFQEYTNCPQLRSQLIIGCMTFLTSVHKKSGTAQGKSCWKSCEVFLLDLAMDGHPALSHFMGELWGVLLSACTKDTQMIYIETLYRILSSVSVRCLSHQMIDDKLRQFSMLFGKILRECHQEVRQQIWNILFDTCDINSVHQAVVRCVILDCYNGPPDGASSAPKWVELALANVQQEIHSMHLESPNAPCRSLLEHHIFWLVKCIAAVMRIYRMDGPDFVHGEKVAEFACGQLQDWERLPVSLLRTVMEIIPICSEELSHAQISDLLPLLARIVHKYAHMSEAVARVCRQRALTISPPKELFHFLLHHPHWLVLHHTVEALVTIGRQGKGEDVLNLVPPEYHGQDTGHPFNAIVKAYLSRQHECPPAVGNILQQIHGVLSGMAAKPFDVAAIEASIGRLSLKSDSARTSSENYWAELKALESSIQKVAKEGLRLKEGAGDHSAGAPESLELWRQEATRLRDLLSKEIGNAAGDGTGC